MALNGLILRRRRYAPRTALQCVRNKMNAKKSPHRWILFLTQKGLAVAASNEAFETPDIYACSRGNPLFLLQRKGYIHFWVHW